jgi:GMP synthase (glutamine-hydrolysing)
MAHSQTVLKPPPGTVVLGRSGHDPHQILRHSTDAWSVQFHPEFTTGIMEGFLRPHQMKPATDRGGPPPRIAGARDASVSTSILHAFLRRYAPRPDATRRRPSTKRPAPETGV